MFLMRLYLIPILIVKCSYVGWSPPPHHQRIPEDVMVDVINRLGIQMLAKHNENNDNNIAFSPYGALSVLVALGEGLRGEAVDEILEGAQIPPDIALIRVGLRDIHRHLKSYFIAQEGFLSGLRFSHDYIRFNSDYEYILKFYGYDVNTLNNPNPSVETTEDDNEAITESITTTIPKLTTTSEDITTLTIQQMQKTSTVVEITPTTPVTTTSISNPNILNTTSIPLFSVTNALITEASKFTTENSASTTFGIQSDRIQIKESESEVDTSSNKVETTQTIMNMITETSTDITIQNTVLLENSTVSKTMTINENSEKTTTINNELDISTTIIPLSTIAADDEEIKNTVETTMKTNEIPLNRSSRSIIDFVQAKYYDYFASQHHYSPQSGEMTFLINGKYRQSNINFMTYDTSLPFYYVSHLNALALRFPLDSSKYYLLLLLPTDEDGVDQLLCDMKRMDHTLRYIIEKMRYTRVKAVIPQFMLKGNVILTTTLQKMGIRRIFEPRQSDFSFMTTNPDIYVTNIEQAVSVNIKNYGDGAMNIAYGNLQQFMPVHFKADHPFLYFVIDSELDVTLVSGKIVNPINSRIR